MAFGDQSKKMGEKKAATTTTDGEKTTFESPYMPIGSGTRLFRVLPLMKDGQIVYTPRLSSSGTELREGNKKTGKVLMAQEPEEEVVFRFAWWQVMVGGNKSPRKLILDGTKWNNPLRKHIMDNYDVKSKEASAIKTAFALNVFDKTPVFIAPDGTVWYKSESGNFDLKAYGDKGKLITDKDQLPEVPEDFMGTPLNRVRILEGSYGKPGGKHLFHQLAINAKMVEDNDGMLRRLTEFTCKLLTTTGASWEDTSRMIRNQVDFSPVSDDIARLPRYDLKTWLKPWPDEAIVQLIDGADFNKVVEEYGIQLYPELEAEPEVEDKALEIENALFDE